VPDLGPLVASLLPELKDDLARLVAIPSISEWGFPERTRPALLEAHQAVVELFRDAGVDGIVSLELERTAPVITGEIPAPEGAPTVLLYGHYDGDDRVAVRHPIRSTRVRVVYFPRPDDLALRMQNVGRKVQ
jgi:hypothetical protein